MWCGAGRGTIIKTMPASRPATGTIRTTPTTTLGCGWLPTTHLRLPEMPRGNLCGAAEALEERRLGLFPAGGRRSLVRPPGKYRSALLLVVSLSAEARGRAFHLSLNVPQALTTSHNSALYTGKPEMGSRLSGSVSSLTLQARQGGLAMGLPPPALASITPGRMSWLTQAV